MVHLSSFLDNRCFTELINSIINVLELHVDLLWLDYLLCFSVRFIFVGSAGRSSCPVTFWRLTDCLHFHREVKDTAFVLTSRVDLDGTFIHTDKFLADHEAESDTLTIHLCRPSQLAKLSEKL